jgi:hypothetical protein
MVVGHNFTQDAAEVLGCARATLFAASGFWWSGDPPAVNPSEGAGHGLIGTASRTARHHDCRPAS